MDVYAECKRLLEVNNYEILPSTTALDQFRFEDESLMGMVWVVASPQEIIENWRAKQERFLKENAVQLRKAQDKSWNMYVVLLAEGTPRPDEKAKLAEIEEDFRSARKIAQADLKTRLDLQRALYPLLPIQNFVSPDEENRARLTLDTKINQANLQSPARVLLEVDLTEESLNNFIAAHETQKD
jgi:hypothetical protein